MTEKLINLEERARRAVEESANLKAQTNAKRLRQVLGKIGLTGKIVINLQGENAYCVYEGMRFVGSPHRPEKLSLEYKVGYRVKHSSHFDNLHGFHAALMEMRLNERAPTWWEELWHSIKLWWHGHKQ